MNLIATQQALPAMTLVSRCMPVGSISTLLPQNLLRSSISPQYCQPAALSDLQQETGGW